MICLSLANKNIDQIFGILEDPKVQMAEIRLDSCPLDTDEIEDLFGSVDKPLIATYRITDPSQAADAEAKLLVAINSGAAYIDLDIDAPAMMSKRLRREAREAGTLLIRSFHDYEGTDSTRALCAIVEKALHLGADVVKIATTATSEADLLKVEKLYDSFSPETLVAFCMGGSGRPSRLKCLEKGAPFTFACLNKEESTAPGQLTLDELYEKIYGNMPAKVGAEPVYPGCSKSYAQRAIILAAVAEGTSVLEGYTTSGDNEAAIAAAKAIGAKVVVNGTMLEITGTAGKINKVETLHAGESGFLTRMMIPLLAILGRTPVTITGEKTLLKRPLPGASAMLEPFGICIDKETVPLTVSSCHLERSREISTPREITIDGSQGSQLVSGLLSALPLAKPGKAGKSGYRIRLENPKSIPYIFMTLDIMRRFGVTVDCEMEGGEEFANTQDWSLCEAIIFQINGGEQYQAANFNIEADWSAAANFMTAGAIFGKADIDGLDTKSLQADLSILDILPLAGATVSQEEENGRVHVNRGPLRGFELDASNCPDLVPIVAVLAAFCQGTSIISGVARLASKESNRPGVITEMLCNMGVRAKLQGDKLRIEGHSLESRLLSGRLLKGGNFSSYGDHRIAMALAVAGLGAGSPVVIDDVACVSKSFPSFVDTFDKFTGKI